jgi:N-acetylmuramoyl-L-alanine amidase
VGKLNSRCIAQKTCNAAELAAIQQVQKTKGFSARASLTNKIEMRKVVPARYPSNEDSIGIEIVGRCILPKQYNKPGLSRQRLEDLRARYGVFEQVTPAQNTSLQWLVDQLQVALTLSTAEVWRHPVASQKNSTEASTAKWTP